MAKLPNYICVFDLETTDRFVDSLFPVQIAFKMYDYYSLDEVPNGEFSTLCKPPDGTYFSPEAMAVHKIPMSAIELAPPVSLAWKTFVDEVQKFNPGKGKYNSPIVAGYNIEGFDLKVVDRLNKLYYGDKPPVLFNEFRGALDLMKLIQILFDTSAELGDVKFDTVRQYFGISSKDAHRADLDVRQEGELLVRLLRFFRRTAKNSFCKFKGSFKDFDFGNAISY